jgi:HAD superfamily hydrolase (TIGR01459 family)
MPAPDLIPGLSTIAAHYDAVLCDVWGVIHNGRWSFAESCAALVRFQETRGPVVLISNSPRPAHDVVAQLRSLGVPDAAWTDFVTSGDVTRDAIAQRAPGPAWAVGPARDGALYAGLDVTFAETPEQAAFVTVSGLFDDEIETPDDYSDRLKICADRGLVLICANPDIVVHRGTKLIYCAGALAALYADLGGEVVMAGKPYAPIYAQAYTKVDKALGRTAARDRLLAIGDGLPTDVKGANAQNLPLLFIGGGIHGADTTAADGGLNAMGLARLLDQVEAKADYAMAGLVW